MKPQIPSLIKEFKHVDAFWAAAEDVMTDTESQQYFLSIVGKRYQIVHLRDDIDRIKEEADKGNPYMKLAYARIHDLLQPDSDSLDKCLDYYQQAAEKGIIDAWAYLAWQHGSGVLGEKDTDKYFDLLNKALDGESPKAAEMTIRDMIYGHHNVKRNPKKAQSIIEEFIDTCKKNKQLMPHIGTFYDLMANACDELGDKEKAEEYYLKAGEAGINTIYYELALCKYTDENMQDSDGDHFKDLMCKAQDANDPRGYLDYSFFIGQEVYDSLNEEDKKEIRKEYMSQLNAAAYLGETLGALFLGQIYELGLYDTEINYQEAFSYYALGAMMYCPYCLEALARMIIKDQTAPSDMSEEFGYECAYRAMLFGADTLNLVISGYKHGFLTHHAAAIEQRYLPEYEKRKNDL